MSFNPKVGPTSSLESSRESENESTDDLQNSTSLAGSAEMDEEHEVMLRIRRLTVLLVEDNADSRALLSRYLTDAGAEVEFAENGLEGLKKALSDNFDVVLMDIQMPRIDGLDAVRKLRGWGYDGSVVAVTGHSRDAERDECLHAGFDEYLTKPVDRAKLLYTIACQPRRRSKPPVH